MYARTHMYTMYISYISDISIYIYIRAYKYRSNPKFAADATSAISHAVQVRGIYGLGGFLKMSKELLVLKLGLRIQWPP